MTSRPHLFRASDDDVETGLDGDDESDGPILLEFALPGCGVDEQDAIDDFDDEFDDDFEDEQGDEYGFESDEVSADAPETACADEFDEVPVCLQCVADDVTDTI